MEKEGSEKEIKEEEQGTGEERAELTDTAERAETEKLSEEILEGEETETAEEPAEEAVEAEEQKPAPAEEEAKPAREEKAKEEEEIVEERFYTIPLSKAWIMPPNRRAPRAMRMIRSFIAKHMKLEARKEGEEDEESKSLVISNEVNETVWRKGIEKPPRKIRVRAAKDKEGNVTVYLAEGG